MGKKKGKNRTGYKNGKTYQHVNDDYEENYGASRSKHQGKKNKGANKFNKKQHKEIMCQDAKLRQMIEGGPNGTRKIVEMAMDGNCLFRSISHQLHNDYGENHEEVRHEICNYLDQNEEDFSIFLLMDDQEEDVMDFDDYVAEMRDDATWGGDVEIVCAARLYKRKITIFSASGAYNIGIGDEKPSGPDLLLSYHENSHYNSVHDADKESSLHDGEMLQNRVGSHSAEETNQEDADSLRSQNIKRKPALKKNDLCHCGSKRKYKKCCLAADKSRIRSEKFKKRNNVGSTSEEEVTDDSHDEDTMVGSFNILTI